MSEAKQNEILLDVRNLKKYFNLGHKQILHAVDDISFTVRRGETLGLVGESGCGKTTVGRTLIGLYEADGGEIIYGGKDLLKMSKAERKRENITGRMQMIFQDPYASLNPYFTVGEIIGEGMEIQNWGTKAERQERVWQLLEQVGLHREHANRFPHEFSGGQRQRVGIARSLALNPEFIVCDEATSALDVSVQAQIINMLIDLREKMDLTYLVVAHDLSVVRYISDRVAVMYLGQIVEIGSVQEVYEHPLHMYTKGLLSAVPVADPDYEQSREHDTIIGEISSPVNPKPGCRFASRCPFATDRCRCETPQLTRVNNDHAVACFHTLE